MDAERIEQRRKQIIDRIACFVFGAALSNFITIFVFMVIK
jgi:hypothetical protein